MSEEGAAPSIAEANTAARAQLVNRLQCLWQSDPASYWKEFKASGLEARDVWPNASVYVESDKLKSVPAKQPGKSYK
jgi:hypothetical protein